GLEILSISLYVLAGFTRDQVNAIEGALKYFLLGAFSTGFLLYGIALFYGASGRIDLPGLASLIAAERGGPVDPMVLAATALVLIGLAFKIAAVPFHFWAPDVYQGAMAPVAGFMATGTKAAAFAALLRVLSVALGAVVSAGAGGPGRSVVLFYLGVYAFMTIGAFSVAAIIGRSGEGDQGYAITAYAGLSRRRPFLAAAMAIFMLSLTGIPPTGGF